MSTLAPPQAVLPKRQHGRKRVEAILEAATALFAEKPYDAVTMTEIAARSATAIGSLYRFFPAKEVLAGALLERYGERLLAALDDLAGHPAAQSPAIQSPAIQPPAPLSPAAAAQALLAIAQRLRRERSVALALIDIGIGQQAGKHALRDMLIERFGRLLSRLGGSPGPRREKAIMLLHLMKTAFALQQDDPALQTALDREASEVLRLYLASAAAA